MGKGFTTATGILGLTVIAFLGGYFANEKIHQKREDTLQFLLADARVEGTISDNMNYTLIRDSFNKTLSDFGTKTTKYLSVHKMFIDGKKDEALETLEGYALDEISWTEDYLELVRDKLVYSNLVKRVEEKFLDKKDEARRYLHQYWAQRGSKKLKPLD